MKLEWTILLKKENFICCQISSLYNIWVLGTSVSLTTFQLFTCMFGKYWENISFQNLILIFMQCFLISYLSIFLSSYHLSNKIWVQYWSKTINCLILWCMPTFKLCQLKRKIFNEFFLHSNQSISRESNNKIHQSTQSAFNGLYCVCPLCEMREFYSLARCWYSPITSAWMSAWHLG